MLTDFEYTFIKILTGSDLSMRKMPFMKAVCIKKGPIVWLTGCVHGDEVGGMVIIQEVFKMIKKIGLLKGKVYAFPLLNPIGFENASRKITFTEEDLNRSFPGNPNGSLAERIAHKIFTTILNTDPDLVLDLHNDWIKSIPYILMEKNDDEIDKRVYKKVKKVCMKTGLLKVRETDDVPSNLSTSLIKKDIPSLTLELGESYVINEKNVELGVTAIINVLVALKMLDLKEKPLNYIPGNKFGKKFLHYTGEPLCSKSGVLRFLVNPGDIVKRNQPLAKIYNAFGKKLDTLTAKNPGIVIGLTDSSVAFPGTPVIAIAEEKKKIRVSSKKNPVPKLQKNIF